MKRLLLSVFAITIAGYAFSQCSDLFFSEYVEGGNNNKALEIYNPTAAAIDLSNYQIVRWSNGATNSDQDIRYVQPLTGNVPAYGTYVAILDRRDPLGTGVDTILDPVLQAYGENNNADFYSPDYNSGTLGARVLTFNGDDAISLEKNNGVSFDILDIFGLIGERPQTSLGGTGAGWTDSPDYWDGTGAYWSKDQTLYRKQSIQGGVTTNPGVPYNSPGGFNPTLQWDSMPRNYFDHLGCHACDCDPNVSSVVCIVVGIKETLLANTDKRFILYPNPGTSDKDVLIVANENFSIVELYDALGRRVMEIDNNNDDSARLNSGSLESGLYFVKVLFDKDQFETHKLIIE
ncbi:MAG: T9SS type A sorting domain-containing protein [Flavobacteriales bacterium]|nr:T9SS type A sorting domain-containing protein [Flavobacteriales bacterium]